VALEWSATSENEDIDRLYRCLARRLEHIVRIDVHAPDALIEEACQVAWGRLLDHSERVRRDTALAWLAATAVHEAFRLLRRGRREVSLDAVLEADADPPIQVRSPGPDELLEQRERIATVSSLPVRQQRVVWLQALGLSYTEMASHERCSRRTIQRQVLRAREDLRRGLS
jgi:RNA polymerase sigma factor (sigma-70 family)